MSAPQSAQPLPSQTPNNSAPIAYIHEEDVTGLVDSLGKPVSGKLELVGYITQAWRYLMGTFAQTSTAINPNFTLTISNPPTQAQVEALVAQVQLLSKQLGRTA